jgi:PIN domain nuclease of toxin-antitoxin system
MIKETTHYLLDTHAWFWLAIGDSKISNDHVVLLEKALQGGSVHLCQISLWELAMKEAKGKIQFNRSLETWCEVNTEGISIVDLPLKIAISATRLPGEFHKDPADRIIVATARHHGFTLVTGDGLILKYAEQGHVAAMAL